MRRTMLLLCLFLGLKVAGAEDGVLRVFVQDEAGRPVQAVVSLYPQIYDFCRPWDALTISRWHSLYLTCALELGKEPNLQEWREYLIKCGEISPSQLELLTDERGEIVRSVSPSVYSVYAWSPGFGIACAHNVLVRPNEVVEVVLSLPRVPITMLKAQLIFPPPPLGFALMKIVQNGALSKSVEVPLLSKFVRLPLAQWHPRSSGLFDLGEFTVLFEADGHEARRSFRLEKWGEEVNLGIVEFSPRLKEQRTGKKVKVVAQVFWSDGKTPASNVKVCDKTTDRQGRVRLNLNEGGNRVSIQVPKGFWQKGMTSFHWVYVTPETKGVRIVLPKPAKVQGVVRYEGAIPVVNAEVSLSVCLEDGEEFSFGRGEGNPDLTARTDEKGAFVFPTVPPGKFVLRVWNGRIFYERKIQLQSGQNLQVSVTLSPPEMRQVLGEIKLPSGEPASKAAVLIGCGGVEILSADEKGLFETKCQVTEGPLFAFVPGEGAAFRWLSIPPSPSPLKVPITLENGSVIGQIVDEHNRPIVRASVRLLRKGFYFTGLLAAHTDSEGRFKISPVPSGEWQLVVEGPQDSHLDLPVLRKALSVPPKGVVDAGTLKVPTKVGQIHGRVIFPANFGKQEGQSSVRIYIQPAGWFKQRTLEQVSPSNPEFRCFPLPPGEYWLMAQGGGWSSYPQKVIIPETGGTVSVTLSLHKAGSLKVLVCDERTGKPVKASATIVDAKGVELSHGFADDEGEALIEDILPGKYTLRVWAPLFQTVELPVSIVAGQKSEAAVRLKPRF